MKAISAAIIVAVSLWVLFLLNVTGGNGDYFSRLFVLNVVFGSVFAIGFAAWIKEMNKPN